MSEGDDDLDPLHQLRLRGVGKRIRKARRDKEWSQDYVADLAGVSRTGLTNLELEGRNIELRTLYRIADALGVHPADLLDDRDG